MSTTTGLLSLNIHEPLTFGGTAIALHPELFQNQRNTLSIERQSDVEPAFTTEKNADAVSSDNTSTERKSTAAPSTMIEAGDMIEFEVWDLIKKHKNQQEQENTSSGRLQQQSHRTQSYDISGPTKNINLPNTQEKVSSMQRTVGFDQSFSTLSAATERIISESPSPTNSSQVASSNSATVGSGRLNNTEAIISDDVGSYSTSLTHTPITSVPPSPTADGSTKEKKRLQGSPKSNLTYWQRRNETILMSPLGKLSRRVGSNGNIMQIDDEEEMVSSYKLRTSFVMRVCETSLTAIKESARSQVSLLRQGEFINIYWERMHPYGTFLR